MRSDTNGDMVWRLSAQERCVLETLRADWQDVLRCTTLDQGMTRIGMPATGEARRRLAEVLLPDPDLRKGMRWHPLIYLLTNDEKALARAILHGARAVEVPSLEDLAQQAAVSPKTVREGLEMLGWTGFLIRECGHLRIAAQYQHASPGKELGLGFHELTIDAREQFNVNCFFDFLMLVDPRYRAAELARPRTHVRPYPGMTSLMVAALQATPREGLVLRPLDDRHVTLRTLCARCVERVTVEARSGRVVSVEPHDAWYLRGGGCGVNVLFCSRAHLREWLAEHPSLERRPHGSVRRLGAGLMV